MPKNFKERLVLTGLIASMMAFVMTSYNVFKADGISTESWIIVIKSFPITLIIAILLNLFIVGPLARKIFFSYINKNNIKKSPRHFKVFIPALMVFGMVSFMSFVGISMGGLLGSNELALLYLKTWIFNIILAMPLQLLLVGPSSRFIFSKIYG